MVKSALLLYFISHRPTRTGCEMLGAFPTRNFSLGRPVRTKTASLREVFTAQRAHGFSPAKACRNKEFIWVWRCGFVDKTQIALFQPLGA